MIRMDNGHLIMEGTESDIVSEAQTVFLTVIAQLNDEDKEKAMFFIKETGELLIEITKGIEAGYTGLELIERSVDEVYEKTCKSNVH